MNKMIAVAAVGLMLTACGPKIDAVAVEEASNAMVTDDTAQAATSEVTDWKDGDTGCHYLVWNGNLTPKLGADGKPVCD